MDFRLKQAIKRLKKKPDQTKSFVGLLSILKTMEISLKSFNGPKKICL